MRPEPYALDHEASIASRLHRAKPPQSLGGLVSWYAQTWELEVPRRLHERGVWHSIVGVNEQVPREHVGGSLLGSPAWSGPVRRYLENGSFEVDEDGWYVRPCHAALVRLAIEGNPIASARMYRLALGGFDVDGQLVREGLAREDGLILYRENLRLLYIKWEPKPTAR